MKAMLKMIETADRLHAESMDDNVNEDAQDAAYIEYHKVVEQIAATLQKVTRGAIDALTAKRMAHFKRDEIKGLVSRLA